MVVQPSLEQIYLQVIDHRTAPTDPPRSHLCRGARRELTGSNRIAIGRLQFAKAQQTDETEEAATAAASSLVFG